MHHSLPKIPILMYHSVSDVPERDKKVRNTNSAYSLSIKQFREQMEYIHKNGYKTLHLDQLLAENSQVPEKSLVITFDDGWAYNYTNVFPRLKEYGLTATIFVVTGFVGQANYMDWNELREMSDAGISIQSHTASHKPLAQLSKKEVEYELETSKKTIEDALGKEVNCLSLPHGVFNDKVLKIAEEIGYQAVCTSEPGFSHEYKNLPVMKRINISNQFQIDTFEKILERNEAVIRPMLLAKKVKNLAKKIVGYDLYRRVFNLRYQGKN
jgi:peptidoglycan/xylan/chitin deacetylase (PgdA/CDA1 family)